VLEVRNASVVSLGDLAGIRNVSNIEFTNDTAAVQTSVIQLSDATVDALVNSTLATVSTDTTTIGNSYEVLYVTALDNAIVSGASTQLNLDGSLIVNAANIISVTGGGGSDTIIGGAGADTIVGAAGADVMRGGSGIDVFSYASAASFGTFVGAAAATGSDTISDFVAGVGGDVIRLANAAIGNADGTFSTSTLTTANITGGINELIIGSEAFADTAAVITAIRAVTQTSGTIFVVYVTDYDGVTAGNQSATQVWYDANPNVDGGEYVVATLTGINTLALHGGITAAANFASGG
jgi:hypothetical protein